MLHIYIDADACPVKSEVYRVAERHHLQVTLVSNTFMRIPDKPWIRLERVPESLDAADDWIADQVQANDIVITSDIPLADRCVKQSARVLTPNGREFTDENIGEALAARNLMTELRSAGQVTTGPPPMKKQDRSRFLHELDQMIRRVLREANN
ncbi:MAG: YaiI/YqxD family protein [candidate division KSB1 bacterium]|nr:YaiI/YqxD family protein [candidate division KSB1 bacterium]